MLNQLPSHTPRSQAAPALGPAVKHLTVPCRTDFKGGALAPEQPHLSICAVKVVGIAQGLRKASISGGLHFRLEKPSGAGQNRSLARAAMKGKSISRAGCFARG